MTTPIDSHKDHKWVEIPPCIYCDDCGVKLYQGELPVDEDNKEQLSQYLDDIIKAAKNYVQENC